MRQTYLVAVAALTALYLAFMALVGLWPSPVDRPVHEQIETTLEALHQQGVPTQLNYGFVEFSANIWFFVPLGVLLALLVPAAWWLAVVIGVVISLAIEGGQLALRPERFASGYDVVANSLGVLVGALALAVARAAFRRGRHKAQRPRCAACRRQHQAAATSVDDCRCNRRTLPPRRLTKVGRFESDCGRLRGLWLRGGGRRTKPTGPCTHETEFVLEIAPTTLPAQSRSTAAATLSTSVLSGANE